MPPAIARRHARQLWAVAYVPRAGFALRAAGCARLPEELLECLPDFQLAWAGREGDHDAGGGGDGGGVGGAGGDAEEESGFEGAAVTTGGAAADDGAAAAGGGAAPASLGAAYYRTASTAALGRRFGDLLYRLRDMEVTG